MYSEAAHHELEPARGTLAVARFLKALVASAERSNGMSTAPSNTPTATAMRRLRRLVKPGSLVFVITDGRQMGPAEYADLTGLTRHNNVGLILVYDEFEASLPELSKPLKVCDSHGEFTLPVAKAETQRQYAERFAARLSEITKFCREHRILFAALTTAGDPFACVQRLLSAR